MPRVHLDFETASPQPLGSTNSVGVYRYVEDPETRVWGFAWCFDSGAIYRWCPGDPEPTPLLDHIKAGGAVVAHNAAFERLVWNRVLLPRYAQEWPVLTIAQLDCTMARAQALGLPASLEKLAEALGTDARKDLAGAVLMKRMAKQRGKSLDGENLWWDAPEMVSRLMDYCVQDVRTEVAVDALMAPLSDRERQVWELDQRINDRGVPVDIELCRASAAFARSALNFADAEMRRITGYAVGGVQKNSALAAWVSTQGIPCTSVAKGEVPRLASEARAKGLTAVTDALALRESASKTSTAKFAKMLACVCSDGRLRGLLAYHGARTGRWAGRLVQPQNFPRFDHENPLDASGVRLLTELLRAGIPHVETIQTMVSGYGDALGFLSKSLRGILCAEPDMKFISADFSNIEGRVNAWLAGETWKLQAFKSYDEGAGPDLYVMAYARSFGVEPGSVSKRQRQIGKVQELALGYQGGLGAFAKMVTGYGIRLADIVDAVRSAVSVSDWNEFLGMYAVLGTAAGPGAQGESDPKHGLDADTWSALKLLVMNWRTANPMISRSWHDYQGASIDAVRCPGVPVGVRNGHSPITFFFDGYTLFAQLPSGRILCHNKPALVEEQVTRVDKNGNEYVKTNTKLEIQIVDSMTNSLKIQNPYGGLLCENFSQAVARDIMVDSMFRLEEAGYSTVLTVHDEILAEVPSDFGSPGHFSQVMSETAPEYAGLPISVKGWEDRRFVK